ncbi:MAG: competence protein ComEC [Acidimicrobiaceae bacterium]|jgi:competence protein ComEC
MTDRAAVVLALAVICGALVGRGPTPWVGALVVVVAFVVRQPAVLVVGAFVLSGGLTARADAGLVTPRPGPFDGWATMLTDPEASGSGVSADAHLDDGRHVQLVARSGGSIGGLRIAQAGERVRVVGRLERPPPGASWLAARHIVAVLAVDDIRERTAGAPWMRAANGLRDLLVRGADGLPVRERPLFLGFVLGDTRGQPVDIADDFRGAGLTHLLAVSGENVAFVLALAGPLLRRLGLRARLPATLGVIGFFAVVTRFEPSVLRASVMAALAVTSLTLGREASSMRLLALAVTVLVFTDPFLVRVVGFQLSAGACLGIAVLSPQIVRALPGPRVVAEALAVTLAAQAGVAPVLVTVFGGIPVAGVPANLLVAPAAGPVMVWGLAAGMSAGLLGEGAATVLHWPTHFLITWIAGVAHWAASLPLGEIHGRELLVLAIGVVLIAASHHVGFVGVRRAGTILVASAVLAPAMALRAPVPVRMTVTPGATLWRADATVLDIDGRVDGAHLLEGLRRAGIARLDLVVARTSSSSVTEAIDALRHRFTIEHLLTPTTTTDPAWFAIGGLRVEIRPVDGRLTVEISADPTGSARGPPV